MTFSPLLFASFPLEHWSLLNDNYVTDYFVAMTASEARVVGVGPKFIATSSDGREWNFEKICDSCLLQGVAYGNGITVAIGLDTESYLPVEVTGSIKGRGWYYNPQFSLSLASIVFYDGKFWGTDGSSIFSSTDGVHYTIGAF